MWFENRLLHKVKTLGIEMNTVCAVGAFTVNNNCFGNLYSGITRGGGQGGTSPGRHLRGGAEIWKMSVPDKLIKLYITTNNVGQIGQEPFEVNMSEYSQPSRWCVLSL